MSLAALPSSNPVSPSSTDVAPRRWPLWLTAFAILALGAVGYWIIARGSPAAAKGIILDSGQFYPVVPTDFEVKVSQKGELQAVNNIDIVCQVEGQTTITTIVKEGASVKKGQVLATLDASTIKQKIEDSTLDVQKAEADLVTAKEMKDIQESQNAANLEAAQVALDAAKLDLEAYIKGTYPQALQTAQTTLEKAKITLKTKQETYAQTQNLFNKNFVTATDVKTAEIDVADAGNAVAQAETALTVLVKYTHPTDLAAKKTAVSQSEQKLVRTQRENAANLTQKVADVNAKEQSLTLLKRRLEHYNDQLEACTITAPADGLVVYATSGDRWSQTPIQEGALVRERQPLLRLPDTSSMKAVVRVQEAIVPNLREGMDAVVSITGVDHPIRATLSKISVLADSSQRFWGNPDTKEYPVELSLEQTPANVKPGLDCKADIRVAHASGVLAVNLASLYSAGDDTYVFVRDGDRVRPQVVKVGLLNEEKAQVKSGLTAGQQVLLLGAGQGRDLLEQAGIKVQPTTRPSDFDSAGGNKDARRGNADRSKSDPRLGNADRTNPAANAAADRPNGQRRAPGDGNQTGPRGGGGGGGGGRAPRDDASGGGGGSGGARSTGPNPPAQSTVPPAK